MAKVLFKQDSTAGVPMGNPKGGEQASLRQQAAHNQNAARRDQMHQAGKMPMPKASKGKY